MTSVRKPAESKKQRPTVGVLIGRLGDVGYAANAWPRIAAVAAERDVNPICFVGGALNAPKLLKIVQSIKKEKFSLAWSATHTWAGG